MTASNVVWPNSPFELPEKWPASARAFCRHSTPSPLAPIRSDSASMVQPPSERSWASGSSTGRGVRVGEAGEFDIDQLDERVVARCSRFGVFGRVDRSVDVVEHIGRCIGGGDRRGVAGTARGGECDDCCSAEDADHGETEEDLAATLFDRLGELRVGHGCRAVELSVPLITHGTPA